MVLTKANSYNRLFVKCIVLSTILNLCFYFINNLYDIVYMSFHPGTVPTIDYTVYVVLETAQMCCNLFLGLIIRKTNRNLFSQNIWKRKKIVNIILIGLLFLLIIFCAPDIIAMPYNSILIFIYNVTGLNIIFTIFDYASILICLGAVFFYKPGQQPQE